MLPQFEFSEYGAQIFWLLVCFSVLYVCMRYRILPPVEEIRQKRQDEVQKILRQADEINVKADELTKVYEAGKNEIEDKTETVFLKSRKDIWIADEEQEKELNRKFQKALHQSSHEVKENRLLIMNHLKSIQKHFTNVFFEVVYKRKGDK